MSYNPPSETNWHYTHRFDDTYANAYEEGYQAASKREKLDANPYPSSNHERDSDYNDELHYWWYSGWMAWEDEENQTS